MLRIIVTLGVAVSFCGTALGQINVDLQGSVSWPSALSGQDISISVNVENTTDYDTDSLSFTFDPDNWPSPNEGVANVNEKGGDVIDAWTDADENGITELTGSDGERYAYYISTDDSVSGTYNVGLDLGLSISITVNQEDESNTTSSPSDGDTNSDGDVDWFDMETVNANYGTSSGASWSDGDFDGDGDVDFGDWLAANANYSPWF